MTPFPTNTSWHPPSAAMIGQPFGQTVIFLNGVSSSGKTTIARVLQATLPVPYLHVQLDSFEQMLPDRYDEGSLFDWPVLFPRLLSGFHRSIAELAGVGNNLIVDHVAVYREGWPSTLIECAYLLAPYGAFLIGVHCPLDELLRREQARGDRPAGTAARQFERVHHYGIYDFEFDTSVSQPEDCARAIISHVMGREPLAFAGLRSSV
jgi:chloramphenicol 3-O phosphotransferase